MKKKPIVGIIDTGTSNIRSVFYALKESGAEIKQIKNSEEYSHIDGLVVPGIGRNLVFLFVWVCKFYLQKVMN